MPLRTAVCDTFRPRGVAIETTYGELRDSIAAARFTPFETWVPPEVVTMNYEAPGTLSGPLTKRHLIRSKRPAFRYEEEVRVVLDWEPDPIDEKVLGTRLPWDPAQFVHSVRVHPRADTGFYETVRDFLKQDCPPLGGCLTLSDIAEPPPT
jgi:hypothetical protein